MRRLLLLGAIAAAVLVPAATAAPAATHTVKGTVIAKDRAHHALVVARPGGLVQTIVAPKAFAHTTVGNRVVIRFSLVTGKLATALAVTPKGVAHTAIVHGTVVRLAKQKAVINAGGSLLKVTLGPSKQARTLALATSGPSVGDEVEVEVEIGDDGGLGADQLVQAGDSAAGQAASGGELEVRGKVTTLAPSTATVAGSITVTSLGNPVTCAIPAGSTLAVKEGDLVEIECTLVGDPGTWTVRVAKGEDEHKGSGAGGNAGSGKSGFVGTPTGGSGTSGSGDDGSEVEVVGTIAAPFSLASTSVTVTPATGTPVTCAITAGSLSAFAAGDSVKIECKSVAGALTLKEIEKASASKAEDESKSGDDNGDDSGDDDGGSGGHDD